MITDLEYTKWLSDSSAVRCILVEVGVNVSDVETTRYLSNRGYVTSPTDTPSNTVYLARLKGAVKLTESLSMTSTPALSYGDIEIDNTDGGVDSWLNDVWDNRDIKVFYGDIRWERADFRLVFSGVVDTMASQGRGSLNLNIRDGIQRLNTPLSDVKLSGGTVNEDKLIPLTFGECHNVSPLLSDATIHEYQVHNGKIEDIIEVRDNGAPVSVTKDLTNGKFLLLGSPAGTITASVQGRKGISYENNIPAIIKDLVKNYGNVANSLVDSDIDSVNFAEFTNTSGVGFYAPDRVNLLEVCQQLAGSVGYQVVMSRVGKLQMHRIEFPPVKTPRVITDTDIVEHSFEVDSRLDVISSVKLGYCKNFTVQGNLQTVLPEEHVALFAEEWLTKTVTDSAVTTKYKLQEEPTQVDTLLLEDVSALAEANRRLGNLKVQRTVYKFESFSWLLDLQLGDAVSVTTNRYGLNSAIGTVVGLEPDWTRGRISVKVII